MVGVEQPAPPRQWSQAVVTTGLVGCIIAVCMRVYQLEQRIERLENEPLYIPPAPPRVPASPRVPAPPSAAAAAESDEEEEAPPESESAPAPAKEEEAA